MEHSPTISVVIPHPPGERDLPVLSRLAESDFPPDRVEIVLVEGRRPSAQRNEAVRRSSGAILLFLDHDSLPPPDYLHRVVDALSPPETLAAGGPAVPPDDLSPFQRGVAAVLSSKWGMWKGAGRFSPLGEPRGSNEQELILCNLACRRDLFEQLGGFDETLYPNEENELLNRLLARSRDGVRYDPQLRVEKRPVSSLFEFVRQVHGYGRGRVKHFATHPGFFRWIYVVPLAALVGWIGLTAWRPAWGGIALAVYLAVCVVASFRSRRNLPAFERMFFAPFLFPVLHGAYAVGWGEGLLRALLKKWPESDAPIVVRHVPLKTSSAEAYPASRPRED